MKNRTLNNFIDSFIVEHKTITSEGYSLDIYDLKDSQLEEFASKLIEENSKDSAGWDWLMDDSSREELANSLAQIITSYGDKKTKLQQTLISDLTKAAVHAYKDKMQELVDGRIRYVEQQNKWETAA